MRFTANVVQSGRTIGVSTLATNRADAESLLRAHYGNYSDLRHSPTLYGHIAHKVIVKDEADCAEEMLLKACFARVARWENWTRADIVVNPRKLDGWLEYGISIYRGDVRLIYIAAIQSDAAAVPEFHT